MDRLLNQLFCLYHGNILRDFKCLNTRFPAQSPTSEDFYGTQLLPRLLKSAVGHKSHFAQIRINNSRMRKRICIVDQFILLRKSIALNNVGVSLLRRKDYSVALCVFEDALKVLKSAIDASFDSSLGGESLSGSTSPDFKELQENCFHLQQQRGRGKKIDEEETTLCEYDKHQGARNNDFCSTAHNFSDTALRAAQKRMCCSPSSSSDKEEGSIQPPQQGPHPLCKQPMDDATKAEKREIICVAGKEATIISARRIPKMREYQDIQVDYSYTYIEGCGLLQSSLGLGSALEERPALEILFHSIWIETTMLHFIVKEDCYDPFDRKVCDNEIEKNAMIEDEVNIGAAIVTFNLATTCLCLSQRFKNEPKPQYKVRSTDRAERFAFVGIRTLDLVLEILSKVSDCEGGNPSVHTLATLYFLVYRCKLHAYRLIGKQAEFSFCKKYLEYYRGILQRIEVFFDGGAARSGDLIASAA